MAAISPSPNSAPSVVPPPPTTTPPQPSTTPPPTPTTSGFQPEANPPESSTPLPTTAPPPNSSVTPVVTPPPAESSPPPTTPSPPLTPPPIASSPPLPSVSPPPPQTSPPISSRPPDNAPPPNPPLVSSPPPPSSTLPPTFTPPPTASPAPPSFSPPPTPVSPNPPEKSPPSPSPPVLTPPEESLTPPAPPPPHASPSRPDTAPPTDSPPSVPSSAPPPSVIPGKPTPVGQSPPSSPSSPSLPGNKSGFPQTSSNAPSKGGIGSGGAVAIGVIAGALILGLIGLVAFWMFKRKKRSSGAYDGHVIPASIGSSPRSDIKLLVKGDYPTSYFGGSSGTITPSDHGGYGHSRSWFTYHELSDATGGFSDENLLGEGGFGCVYKGHLVDGRIVAVKQLKIGGGQGEREFKAEVEIISRIHHRHLVSLVGYCIWESKRLLVYDYVPNNTLHFHLHEEGRAVMDWGSRVKIAVGAARGIAYLHEDCHPRIIHRDIKSSNILIDNNYEAQVSDFGLAKLAMDAETHVSTRVMGTFGYMAPEYATTGKLTEKSDVYSFGVVLLELITGRRPVDESQPLGDESLVEWARPLLSRALDMGEFDGLVDPRLEKNFIESEMFRMTEAAAACVRHSSSKRPRMGQVVRALSASDSGDLSNGLKVGESQIYNSAQQSAEIRWFRRMAFGSQDSNSDLFSHPSQNLGFSTHIRQNMSFSAQSVQDGNSRQHINDPQNPSFSGQSGINPVFSIAHGPDGNTSGQSNQNARRPTDLHSQNVDI
ncbi:hypothetical protein RND81_02G200500 [Saponaria officinalis]|uniref:non-specific serine/threonine protein kinase n=1 Tax=Saponaria officinalis TaxID=3572 RepID=A0AAW1MV93_SAPOF